MNINILALNQDNKCRELHTHFNTTHQDVFIATQHTLQRSSSLATIVVNNQSKLRCPVAGHSMAYNSVDHDRQLKKDTYPVMYSANKQSKKIVT